MSPIVSGGGAGGGLSPFFNTTISGSATTVIDSGAAGVPQSGNVLEIFLWGQSSTAAVLAVNTLTFNADSGAHYDDNAVFGNNSAAGSNATAAGTSIRCYTKGSSGTATIPGMTHIVVPAYTSTAFWKACVMTFSLPEETAANAYTGTVSGGWRSTAAITRFQITAASAGNWTAGTVCTAYIF